MASSDKSPSVLVIGAGPAGYPAAFHAADLGMDVTMVDPEENPGGVCLYRGCIPSKALLHAAQVIHEARQASEWGISFKGPEIDLDKLRNWKQEVIQKLTGGLAQISKQRKIKYIRGWAKLKDARTAAISPLDGEEKEKTFDYIIIATGSRPASIPPAIKSDRLMTSREALDLDDIPETLLVVGGGYIGLELGQVYASLGAKVSVVEMLPNILPGADRDLAKVLEKRLKNQFEAIMTGTRVVEMKETKNGIKVRTEGKEEGEQEYAKVMMSVGRKPFTDSVGIENTDIELDDDGFIKVDEQRRTAEETIFAIGDVSGQPMLAHKGTHEARVAVEAIAGGKAEFAPYAIPAVVFSDPEIAWTGLTEQDAKAQGVEVDINTFPWAASGRATTVGRNDGLTKLITEPDTGRVLGVGIAGYGAGELIAEATLAVEMGAVAEDLALTIHTHPTLSETLMEAAESVMGHSTHFYRKKKK